MTTSQLATFRAEYRRNIETWYSPAVHVLVIYAIGAAALVARRGAMPLRAAGIDATVHATFADERTDKDRERWDVSRPISEVMAERNPAKQ